MGTPVEIREGAHLVVLRLSAMGDVVHGIGAVIALREARPDLRITWVVQRPFAPLLAGLPGVEVVPHDRGAGARGYVRTGRALRATQPDVALDLQGNWKSAGLARLSGAALRIGAAGPARRERASAALLNRCIEIPQRDLHPARQAIALVRAIAAEARDLLPWLGAPGAEIEREAEVLRALGVDPARPFRVLVLGAPDDARSIRAGALRREVAASPLPCVAVRGPGEVGVEAPPGATFVAHGPGELRRLCALGALVARTGGDVVGPDKGATHVLAAAGARTTCLFGPTDPARTGPPLATVLVAAQPPACAPCSSRTCRQADGPVCMDFTSTEGRPSVL